jgi:hypothetical protein
MRNPGGYAVITCPEPTKVNFDRLRCEVLPEGIHEMDAYTCEHCNRIVHVKPGAIPEELGSMCRHCMKMVCPSCAPFACVPWLKKLEMAEKRDIALRSYGIWTA